MKLEDYFSLLPRYHRWAYGRLYERVAELAEPDYFADRGLFFKSVHGSLNHLLLVDRLWLDRLRGIRTGKVDLAAELVRDRGALRQAIFDQCEAFIEFMDNVDVAHIAGDVDYVSSKGEALTMPFAPLAAHIVTHATHHRGQISTVLTQAGIQAPVMDLPYFLLDSTNVSS